MRLDISPLEQVDFSPRDASASSNKLASECTQSIQFLLDRSGPPQVGPPVRATKMAIRLAEADLSSGIVKLDVGASNTPFDVHLELLCACSPYFDTLFQCRFDQPLADPIIRFPEDDAQAFAQVILWMYRGNDSLKPLGEKKLAVLVRLWILASKLEMVDLQNEVMRICTEKTNASTNKIVGMDVIEDIYTHTLPESPMRSLAVDVWVRNASSLEFDRRREGLPRSFLEDLCRGFIRKRDNWGAPDTVCTFAEDDYKVFPPLGDRLGTLLPRRTEEAEIWRPASEAQMESRKIKIPRSRIRDTPETSASTPRDNDGNINKQPHITEQMMELSILPASDEKQGITECISGQ
ncbi:hypothetical protein N7462_002253 [Penicillium macrosclerotiorum]|uniref:uncharacterized protein n=1 Tax=Penicillium macrosclerotiorum TaxID=303699 RepID=UPI0025492FD2|nr:uncharacterized protein N7462_002253 [Penicillium macrosclerotiorum]KAJ5692830.1 hypothetical protein N7462_002253 [Penicillium macrosclerotiorum]